MLNILYIFYSQFLNIRKGLPDKGPVIYKTKLS